MKKFAVNRFADVYNISDSGVEEEDEDNFSRAKSLRDSTRSPRKPKKEEDPDEKAGPWNVYSIPAESSKLKST